MSSDVTAGARFGPYEVVSRIGAGGMGEVFLGRDTRLERSVAIKVLPAEFTHNAQFRLRFEREAKVISQLNHPNICTLYDVGEGFLVMELLEGETLAERIARGPMPIRDVLRYGSEIAEALDRAHRAGVIHRDLKPANIMITKSGAKLLDFGLAKTTDLVDVKRDDPTVQKPLTQEGAILGTFQYMAPEQLEGIEADNRTDIFALGSVLYEMVTGARAFDGKTKTSLIAAIVDRDPPAITSVQPLAPTALDHVIRKCLEKDRDERWQSAHDIAQELRWISDAGSQATLGVGVPRRKTRERIAWALGMVLALAIGAGGVMYLQARQSDRPFVTDLAPTRGTRFNSVGDTAGPAVISPNGKWVVYSAIEGATSRLWLRSLVTGSVKPLAGTEGASFPFWSPDSRQIAFDTGAKLMRVDVVGNAPVEICESAGGRGGSWSKDDLIIFSAAPLTPLFSVSASGGEAQPFTQLGAKHTSHRWPQFLEDGKRFIYLATNHQDPTGGANGVYLSSLDGGQPRLIMRGVSNAFYSRGYLLFERRRVLFAQKMKQDGSLVGDPVPISDDVLYDQGIWRAGFSLSDDGVLIHHTGGASMASRLRWFDRSGRDVGSVGDTGLYWGVELSPNQQKVVTIIGDPMREVWIADLQKNIRTKVSVDGDWMDAGSWSPDGTMLYVNALRRGEFVILERKISGGERRIISHRIGYQPRDISPDGRSLLALSPAGELVKIDLTRSAPPATFVRVGNSQFVTAEYSPSGKWIAYTSSEVKTPEVFIASASDPTMRWQVSTKGGVVPRFRGDGKELYYLDLTNRLVAVPIEEKSDQIELGSPQPLFNALPRMPSRFYDVTSDGQRFLVNTLSDEESAPLRVIADWKKRLDSPVRTD